MAGRAKRRKEPRDAPRESAVGDAGAERYMWAFPEGDHVTLSIPGVRDLELSGDEARAIGELLITTANQIIEITIRAEDE
jgi:hypothetical protein